MKRVFALLLALTVLFAFPASVMAASGNTTVYVTRTGSKYHRDGCSYLKSRISISLQDAVNQGYTPCSRCKPPTLDTVTKSYTYSTPKPTARPTPRPTAAPRASEEKKDKSSGWLLAGGGIVAAYLLGKRRGR